MPLTMTLNGHEFTLSNEALVAMATSFWRTKVKERGLMLCENTEIVPGSEHIGGPGSIRERNCRGKPHVGYFHTHPTGTSAPSWWDAYNIIYNSWVRQKLWLACRGARADGLIRCETARSLPTESQLQDLKKRRTRKRYTRAHDDPSIAQFLTEAHTFEAKKIPEIIKPPVPVSAPRIRTEQVNFANSQFVKYIDVETGQVLRVERVY